MIHRALTLPNTQEEKTYELKHVTDALGANSYPLTLNNIIKDMQLTHTSPSPEELVGMFFKNVDPPDTMQRNYATLPYIKRITEQLTRTLRQYDLTVTTKPCVKGRGNE